jgi:site-specific recombinase XerD
MNITLKEIAKTCGISRSVNFHRGRHTYASVVTLSEGIPLETVSRMLGHRSTRMTERYAIVTDEKLDEDMRGLEKRINGKFKFAI